MFQICGPTYSACRSKKAHPGDVSMAGSLVDTADVSAETVASYYNSEMTRLLSYPNSTPYATSVSLAENGFYYMGILQVKCNFCQVVAYLVTSDKHMCSGDWSSNLRLPDDVSDYRYEAHRIISFLMAEWNKIVSFLNKVLLKLLKTEMWIKLL